MKNLVVLMCVVVLLALSSSVSANVLIAAGGKMYDLNTTAMTLSTGMYGSLGVNQIASVASNGDVAIATSGGNLYKYTKTGSAVGSYTAANLLINDIAVDASGNVGVASGYGQYTFNSAISSSAGPIYTGSAPLTKMLVDNTGSWLSMIGSNGYWLATNNSGTGNLAVSSFGPGKFTAVDSSGSIITMATWGQGYNFEDYGSNPFGSAYGPYSAGWTVQALAIDPATDNIYLAYAGSFWAYTANYGAYLAGGWGAGWSVKDMIFDTTTGKLVVVTTSDAIGVWSVGAGGITGFDGFATLPQGGIGSVTDLAASNFAVVPEPATIAILSLGSLLVVRRKRA